MKLKVNESDKQDEDEFEEFTDSETLTQALEVIENSKFFFFWFLNKLFQIELKLKTVKTDSWIYFN